MHNKINDIDIYTYLLQEYVLLFVITDYWYIGLSDKLIEGEYIWETSLQVLTGDTFSNWGSGEPNGAGNEDCVVYAPSRNYQWADVTCTRTEHYICEKRLVYILVHTEFRHGSLLS